MKQDNIKRLALIKQTGGKASQGLINAAFAQKLDELDARAGTFRPTDYREGKAGVSRLDPGRFKGGILESGSVNFPDNAPSGTEMTLTWSGDELARLYGTTMNKFNMLVFGNLVAEAGKVSVTLKVNGSIVDELRDVPLASIIATVDGDARFAFPKVMIPEFCNITVVVRADKALSGGATTTELYAVAYADSSPGTVV